MRELTALVLLSCGRHPASGRPCRAGLDARALELAQSLPIQALEGLHVGDPKELALRDYLGMGLECLTVLKAPPDADALGALRGYLADRSLPDLILAGAQAEAGEGSGLLPYGLAETLGLSLVAGAAAIEQDGERLRVLQARPRGGRRLLSLPFPALVTAAAAAPPRQVSYARARRGSIAVEAVEAPHDEAARTWTWQPARARPKRLNSAQGASAAERLAAASGTASRGGRLLAGLSPDAAAEAVYQALLEDEILPRAGG